MTNLHYSLAALRRRRPGHPTCRKQPRKVPHGIRGNLGKQAPVLRAWTRKLPFHQDQLLGLEQGHLLFHRLFQRRKQNNPQRLGTLFKLHKRRKTTARNRVWQARNQENSGVQCNQCHLGKMINRKAKPRLKRFPLILGNRRNRISAMLRRSHPGQRNNSKIINKTQIQDQSSKQHLGLRRGNLRRLRTRQPGRLRLARRLRKHKHKEPLHGALGNHNSLRRIQIRSPLGLQRCPKETAVCLRRCQCKKHHPLGDHRSSKVVKMHRGHPVRPATQNVRLNRVHLL